VGHPATDFDLFASSDEGGILAANFGRGLFAHQFTRTHKSALQKRPARFDAMRIGSQKVNQAIGQHRFRHLLTRRSKGPHQAAGCNLH
jgi:hypothetical protein